MRVDLDLNVSNRYNIITLVFFITYTIFQPVATVLMRKIGPRYFLSATVVAWGLVMIVRLHSTVPARARLFLC